MYAPALIVVMALYGPAHDGQSRDLSDAKFLIQAPEVAVPAPQAHPIVVAEDKPAEGKKEKKAKKGKKESSVPPPTQPPPPPTYGK
jgi:hypothetical protein